MPYIWDKVKARYKDTKTGRFISGKQVSELAKASIQETGKLVSRLGSKEVRTVLREEVKRETIRQYLLGRGGEAVMSQKDWGTVGGIIKEQYSHLDDFAEGIDELSDAEVEARSFMYLNSAREGLEKGKREAADESGEAKQERWVLGGKNPCDDCKELADMGWVDIGELGQFPGDGGTACLTNCECEIEYSGGGEED